MSVLFGLTVLALSPTVSNKFHQLRMKIDDKVVTRHIVTRYVELQHSTRHLYKIRTHTNFAVTIFAYAGQPAI